jgi:hypothetical protein
VLVITPVVEICRQLVLEEAWIPGITTLVVVVDPSQIVFDVVGWALNPIATVFEIWVVDPGPARSPIQTLCEPVWFPFPTAGSAPTDPA